MRGRWGCAFTLVLLVVCLAGCGDRGGSASAATTSTSPPPGDGAAAEAPEDDAIAVRVKAVVSAPLSSIYSTSATLRAEKRASVTSRTRGVIRQLLAEEGDWVGAGDVLARLEDDQQRIEHERAMTTHATKARELQRAESLHQQGLLSEESYETVRREAEESRQTAQLMNLMLERTTIRAPFAGVILQRHLDTGGNVTDGTPVYEIADIKPLFADVHIPERQIGRLDVGQQVRLIVDDGESSARARIERIAPAVDPSTGTVKVTLTVRQARRLRPGSFVRVGVITDTHDEALVLPRSALVAQGRRWHVYRVNPAGDQVEQLEVALGFEEQDLVEILEVVDGEPLKTGDPVVVVGAAALSDEARVKVMDENETGPSPDGSSRVPA